MSKSTHCTVFNAKSIEMLPSAGVKIICSDMVLGAQNTPKANQQSIVPLQNDVF